MAPKRPAADTPAPTLTAEERRAAKIAAWEARRAQRGRHSASDPLTYNIPSHPPCGPKYVITNVPSPATETEVRHVSN